MSFAASRRGGGNSPLPRRLAVWGRRLGPVWWLGPSVLLIALIIVYPAIEMIRTSFLKVNSIGLTEGSNGVGNYKTLFNEPALGHVLVNTVLWVVGVLCGVAVACTLDGASFDVPGAAPCGVGVEGCDGWDVVSIE